MYALAPKSARLHLFPSLEMHPNAPLIKRLGEVDAWDNPEFRAAVKATGKKQVILAGITTDVCAFIS